MALIALTRLTVADTVRQPVTWLMTAVSLVLLGLTYLFGEFNFEAQDRMRMIATAGVAVGVINGLFLAVVGASQSVHDELASRTALTLFAKPLSRGSFLSGKALGIWLTVAASGAVVALGHLLVLWLAWRYGFVDEHNHGGNQETVVPWGTVLAAHALALAHNAVLTCIAAVLALRLPLTANILVCFAVFVGSHLLAGMGLMGVVVVPALALYNLDDSIQLADHPLTLSYALTALLYTILLCAGWLLAGLALFKRQDIA